MNAERLTCALPSGQPLSSKRWQRYEKKRNDQRKKGKFFNFPLILSIFHKIMAILMAL